MASKYGENLEFIYKITSDNNKWHDGLPLLLFKSVEKKENERSLGSHRNCKKQMLVNETKKKKSNNKGTDKSVNEKAWKRFWDFGSSSSSLSAFFLSYHLNSLYR